MTKTGSGIILSLILAVLMLSGCGTADSSNSAANDDNSAASNTNSVKTNVEELGMIVNVPYESDECAFREFPSQKKLVAVLRLPQNEANRLIADAEKIRPAQRVSVAPEAWFPAELVAQSETTGDDMLNGQSYAANAFFQEPYNDGRITHIDQTDYFILELSSK
jgi:hypothetical protein